MYVTEGVDDFATIIIRFLSPDDISVDTFADLGIFTDDGTALGMLTSNIA